MTRTSRSNATQDTVSFTAVSMLFLLAMATAAFGTELNDFNSIFTGNLTTASLNGDLQVMVNNGSDIQAKIDSALPGQVIDVPCGNYSYSTVISSSKPLTIRGHGTECTILFPVGNTNGMQFSGQVFIQDLQINGYNQTLGSQQDGIRLIAGADYSTVSNVKIIGVTRAAIFNTLANNNYFDHVMAFNVGRGSNEGRGIWISTANYTYIHASYVKNSSRYCFEIASNSYWNKIENSDCDNARRSNDTSGRGIWNSDANYTTIIGGVIQGAALTGINIGGSYVTITGTKIYNISNNASATARGIECDAANDLSINQVVVDTVDDYAYWMNCNNVSIRDSWSMNVPIGIDMRPGKVNFRVVDHRYKNVTQPYNYSSPTQGSISDMSRYGFFTNAPSFPFHVNATAQFEKQTYLSSTTPVLTLNQTTAGTASISATMSGLEFASQAMSAAASYTPAIKFMSTDADFTTTNPKLLGYIVGRATQTYNADNRGGLAIDFATTPDTNGTASTPTVRMSIDQTGNVTLGVAGAPVKLLMYAANGSLYSCGPSNTGNWTCA